MIPAILAQIGLPLLIKAVGAGLDALDNPVAKTAAKGLRDMENLVGQGAVDATALAEANRHAEALMRAELKHDSAVIRAVNKTIRAEISSGDAYVRRWRPSFGYAVALTWIMMMGAIAAAIVLTPAEAPAIIAALVNTSPIWGVALAVLGISVVKRSSDKRFEG
ncbi:3TM-type holin [Thalassospira marina]|uniref:Ribokinase n=1 Tax=Thalassospira marina TaxID=2048283 RepID=A0ABM6Q832_9PROT|nr:3TM-type holin [Thalassospira marina]AUG52127.1 ribokinase [Thalassospira marina]